MILIENIIRVRVNESVAVGRSVSNHVVSSDKVRIIFAKNLNSIFIISDTIQDPSIDAFSLDNIPGSIREIFFLEDASFEGIIDTQLAEVFNEATFVDFIGAQLDIAIIGC